MPPNSAIAALVSTAIMTPNHLAFHGGTHLRGCPHFALGPQTAGHLVEIRFGERIGRARQDARTS